MKKNVTPAGVPGRIVQSREITELKLDQVTGGATDMAEDNPLYSGGGGGAQNPLFVASAATNPLYTP